MKKNEVKTQWKQRDNRKSITKIWFSKLPQELNGNIVVIDAFAASANMSILLSKSPKRLVVVNETTLHDARKVYSDSVLIGESDILKPTAFAFSNQLKDMYHGDATAKTILWMSVNGSRVFERAMQIVHNGSVLAGAFCNSKAVAEYLMKSPQNTTLIMAGNRGTEVDEDRLCADVIEYRLRNRTFDWEEIKRKVSEFITRYYEPTEAHDNLFYLLRLDEFNIVPKCFLNEYGFIEIINANTTFGGRS